MIWGYTASFRCSTSKYLSMGYDDGKEEPQTQEKEWLKHGVTWSREDTIKREGLPAGCKSEEM